MSDVHPSEAEGRTPTAETCVRCGRALILEHERYRGCHYDCREVATLAARSPAPSDVQTRYEWRFTRPDGSVLRYGEQYRSIADADEAKVKAGHLDGYELYVITTRVTTNRVGAPAHSDEPGYLPPELEREFQRIVVASHYEDISPAAPSVEARDADADLWELGQAYIAFHDLCRQDASEAAINAALAHRNELQARIASLLPPEKT